MIFKNGQSESLTAHCDMWRGSSIDADKVAYQWHKLKSDGTWESLAASNSYGITGQRQMNIYSCQCRT